jgi:hypothetical protein
MGRLFDQTLTTQQGVERFAKWVNEIHNWGLGQCLDNFLYDVKRVMAENNGSRGAFSLGPDDVQRLRGELLAEEPTEE